MKRFFVNSLIIAAFALSAAFTSYGNEFQMTMTTDSKKVSLKLAGSGTATIDWGDGNKAETVTLNDFVEEWLGNNYSHVYSDTSSRTITIIGANITHLGCYKNLLTELDVSKNTTLKLLDCSANRLTKLDVSKNTALTHLDCGFNLLTELDVSKNTALTVLFCNYNELTKLDVSKNTELTHLGCGSNQLTKMDVSKNTALISLDFCDNRLTKLDVRKNTELIRLVCNYNSLSCSAIKALYGTLHGNTTGGKTIFVARNPGTGCDTSIAEDKGWIVVQKD